MKLVEIDEKEYKYPVGLDEKRLPASVKVKDLNADGELEGGERHRATNPVWSLEIMI